MIESYKLLGILIFIIVLVYLMLSPKFYILGVFNRFVKHYFIQRVYILHVFNTDAILKSINDENS